MSMKNISLPITTNGSGAATVTAPTAVMGFLYAIEYRPGTIDTGATVTVTCEGRASKPLLTKASAGTSDSWYYPREEEHDVADGSEFTTTAYPLLNGKPQVVIASGGATKAGFVELFYYE